MKRLFIVNPLSERVSRKGSVLEQLTSDDSPIVHLNTFDGLPEAVSRAAEDNIEHVIIEGGDGTVQGVISEFLRQEERFVNFPKFSIIPSGMTNQVSKNIGLTSAKKRRVIARLSSSQLKATTLPLLILSGGNEPEQSGFLFSTGAIPQITNYTKSQLHGKGIGGSLAVIGGVIKAIRGNDDTLMQSSAIDIKDIYQGDHLGTVLTTLPSLLLGLDPFWGKGDVPLRFTWATAEYKKLGRNIVSLWLGRKSKDRSHDGLFSKNCDQLDFNYSGPVVLDGEFLSFPTGKFTIRPSRPVTFLH